MVPGSPRTDVLCFQAWRTSNACFLVRHIPTLWDGWPSRPASQKRPYLRTLKWNFWQFLGLRFELFCCGWVISLQMNLLIWFNFLFFSINRLIIWFVNVMKTVKNALTDTQSDALIRNVTTKHIQIFQERLKLSLLSGTFKSDQTSVFCQEATEASCH